MIVDKLVSSKDYQEFAQNYLGIDLEDYLDLIDDYELTEEGLESVLSY